MECQSISQAVSKLSDFFCRFYNINKLIEKMSGYRFARTWCG